MRSLVHDQMTLNDAHPGPRRRHCSYHAARLQLRDHICQPLLVYAAAIDVRINGDYPAFKAHRRLRPAAQIIQRRARIAARADDMHQLAMVKIEVSDAQTHSIPQRQAAKRARSPDCLKNNREVSQRALPGRLIRCRMSHSMITAPLKLVDTARITHSPCSCTTS